MANLFATRWTDENTGISIEATKVDHGTVIQFAVRKNGMTLNRQGRWEYEPLPSNRDEKFLQRCRWLDLKEAEKALEQAPEV